MATIQRHLPIGSRVSKPSNFGSEDRVYGVTTGVPARRRPGHYYVDVLWEGRTHPEAMHMGRIRVEASDGEA
jgi:hypothetical protein